MSFEHLCNAYASMKDDNIVETHYINYSLAQLLGNLHGCCVLDAGCGHGVQRTCA
jgi:hypothetical protein